MAVSGKTLEELFRNSLRGLVSYWSGDAPPSRSEHVEEPVKVDAVDLGSLLVEFLSEVIARADMNDIRYIDFRPDTLGENFLEGTLLGVPAEHPERPIRAVSYEHVDVTKNPETGLYETELVFEL